MNQTPLEKRCQVLNCLVEGNSIRATVRLTGVAKNTVVKLLADVGAACAEFQDRTLRGLKCQRVQCDEIWSFCYCKQKTLGTKSGGQVGKGDVWTWTAIDADTKLVLSWLVGQRTVDYAKAFMDDVASRLTNRVQLTTDGHRAYLRAVEGAFGWDVDYAMLEKHYGTDPANKGTTRYSPAKLQSITVRRICGEPEPANISTSYAERQNLTMRMSMRRFTRLTNAFSKKLENHNHAVALYFMFYNFARIHQSLRVTPAMEAGVVDRVWEIADIVKLVELMKGGGPIWPGGPLRLC